MSNWSQIKEKAHGYLLNTNMEKRLIYIGSPYSHHDPDVVEENYKKVSRLAARLCSKGHVAFSPITYGHTLLGFENMPGDWEFWRSFCLTFLEKSDELLVYKMEGWENSKGLAAEIEYALEKNIPVRWVEFDPYENVPVEDKREFLKTQGWEQSWHEDNWVESDSQDKEAVTGLQTDVLYNNLMRKKTETKKFLIRILMQSATSQQWIEEEIEAERHTSEMGYYHFKIVGKSIYYPMSNTIIKEL